MSTLRFSTRARSRFKNLRSRLDSFRNDAHLLPAAFLDRAFDERRTHSLPCLQMPAQLKAKVKSKKFLVLLFTFYFLLFTFTFSCILMGGQL